MEKEEGVCNLELARRIKELGVKQESLWYWTKMKSGKFKVCLNPNKLSFAPDNEDISAFTVAELGEMLPKFTEWKNKNDYEISVVIGKSKEQYIPKATMMDDHKESADTEANARAKMKIYLLENKIGEG